MYKVYIYEFGEKCELIKLAELEPLDFRTFDVLETFSGRSVHSLYVNSSFDKTLVHVYLNEPDSVTIKPNPVEAEEPVTLATRVDNLIGHDTTYVPGEIA